MIVAVPTRRRFVAVNEQPAVAFARFNRFTENGRSARAAFVIARDKRERRNVAQREQRLLHRAHRALAHLRSMQQIAEKHDFAHAALPGGNRDRRDDLRRAPQR